MDWFYFYKKVYNDFDYLIWCMIICKKDDFLVISGLSLF